MGNLVDHARRELELIGEEPKTIEGIIRVIQAFADMGHSGGSASVVIPCINELFQFKNLTPLTDDPTEWIYHDEKTWGGPGGIWQNVRNSKAFSKDGGVTYTFFEKGKPDEMHESIKKERNEEAIGRSDELEAEARGVSSEQED